MLKTLKERLDREHREEGFTLIELMVVVLIIAILLAIAIPTFLGARNSANARAAQSNLRNALTAEKTVYVNGQNYSADTSTGGTLASTEASLAWTTSAPANAGNQVGVAVSTDGQTVFLTAYGKDGSCYGIEDVATGTSAGTTYFKLANTACPAPSTTMPTGAITGSTTSAAQW